MVAARLRATGNATTLMALDAAQMQPLRGLIAKPNYLTTGRRQADLDSTSRWQYSVAATVHT